MSVNEASTCMEVYYVCLYVHEPLYQTTVVCCNPIFHRGSLIMGHLTAFHVRVGLAQACPNNMKKHLEAWTRFSYSLTSFICSVDESHIRTVIKF